MIVLTHDLLTRFGLSMTATCAGRASQSWGAGATRWNVVVTKGAASLPVDYKMGSAHTEVGVLDVLACLCSDASSVECYNIDEWCEDFGGKPSMYLKAVEQTKAFKALVGDDYDAICEATQDW